MERLPPAARPLTPSGDPYDHVLSVVAGDTAVPGDPRPDGDGRRRRRMRRLGVIYSGIGLVGRHRRRDTLVDAVEREIDRIVSEHARDRVFVHAGAVVWGDRALLLPGASGSGKSTLVAELVRRGATYLSDDYAVLDADGRVHPYPRPPRLRRTRRSLEELDGPVARPDDGPFPVGWILDLPLSEDRAEDRAEDGVESGALDARALGRGRAVLSLLHHAIPTRRGPDRSLDAVTRAAKSARAFAGRRGEAAEAAAWIVASLFRTRRTRRARRVAGAAT